MYFNRQYFLHLLTNFFVCILFQLSAVPFYSENMYGVAESNWTVSKKDLL